MSIAVPLMVSFLQMLSLLLLRLSGRHAAELLEAGVIDVATQLMSNQIEVESICSNCCGLMWNLSMVRQLGFDDVRAQIGRRRGVYLLLQVCHWSDILCDVCFYRVCECNPRQNCTTDDSRPRNP